MPRPPNSQRQMPRRAELSLSPHLTKTTGRREVKPDLDFAKGHGIGVVQLEPGTQAIPATIGMRSLLKHIEVSVPTALTIDHWTTTLSPMSPNLQRRLLAARNATQMGDIDPLDMPALPGFLSASYDAIRELRLGHQPFSDLNPPREGAVIEVTYALVPKDDGTLGPVIGFKASTVTALEHLQRIALRRQAQNDRIFAAACWPFKGPKFWVSEDASGNETGRIQLWPAGRERTVMAIPELPADPWAMDGEQYADVGLACARMERVFNSLWRAVYAMDERVSRQLEEQGYDFSRVEGTCLGAGPLHEMMSPRLQAGNLTQLGEFADWFEEEALPEIGAEHLDRLATNHAFATHYDFEIIDD